jgi:hypothetical protein
VFAEVRARLAVCKQAAQKFDVKTSNLRKINEMEVRKEYHIEISKWFAALENVNDSEDLQQNIQTSCRTV